mmetsp:Transcript_107560/g.213643  ORF Transcript_107560/g.213643 Transcript_107560/m.213643 type:complete len:222 (+) Transcript_107560:305-970(+)
MSCRKTNSCANFSLVRLPKSSCTYARNSRNVTRCPLAGGSTTSACCRRASGMTAFDAQLASFRSTGRCSVPCVVGPSPLSNPKRVASNSSRLSGTPVPKRRWSSSALCLYRLPSDSPWQVEPHISVNICGAEGMAQPQLMTEHGSLPCWERKRSSRVSGMLCLVLCKLLSSSSSGQMCRAASCHLLPTRLPRRPATSAEKSMANSAATVAMLAAVAGIAAS